MISIVLAVTNDISTDNRVHKIASTLCSNGYQVTIVGRKFKHSENLFSRKYLTRRFRLWFNRSFLFYANYNLRLFGYLLRKQVDIIVANDLDTLLACWLAARLRRKVLIFDSHELFTEVPELVDRPLVKKIWWLNEKLLLPGIHFGYTVSKPIQQYFKDNYNKDFELIRNLSVFKFEYSFKDLEEKAIIIYQGAINKGRGLELMIESLKYLDHVVLWIIGTGDIVEKLKKNVLRLNLDEKVIFIGRVGIDDLSKYTSKANIGISLEEDLGLNYRYALPNKIFDYVQSRVPVIVSDLPEMQSLVEQYQIGKVLNERTPKALANLIKEILSDDGFQDTLRQKLEIAARDLCWQREEEKLIMLYRKASELVNARTS